jgi:hypothetical protein
MGSWLFYLELCSATLSDLNPMDLYSLGNLKSTVFAATVTDVVGEGRI